MWNIGGQLQFSLLFFIFNYLNYGTLIEQCTISAFFWLLMLMKSFNDTEKFMGLILAFLCLKMEEYESHHHHHLMMHYSITIYMENLKLSEHESGHYYVWYYCEERQSLHISVFLFMGHGANLWIYKSFIDELAKLRQPVVEHCMG